MKASYWIALALALIAGGWILSGQFGENGPPAQANDTQGAMVAAVGKLPKVGVREQVAEPLVTEVIVRGRSVAYRTVAIKAETIGRIVEVRIDRGATVKKGDIIARIALKERQARLRKPRRWSINAASNTPPPRS